MLEWHITATFNVSWRAVPFEGSVKHDDYKCELHRAKRGKHNHSDSCKQRVLQTRIRFTSSFTIKVHLSTSTTWRHIGVEVIAPLVLNLGTTRSTSPPSHWTGGWAGLRARLDLLLEYFTYPIAASFMKTLVSVIRNNHTTSACITWEHEAVTIW